MFEEHAAFIIPSYAISFVALSITVLVIWTTYKSRTAELKRMEAEGSRDR
ncbi:MAG: heme exporter protein CcmD [Pseudomonadota bacterium]